MQLVQFSPIKTCPFETEYYSSRGDLDQMSFAFSVVRQSWSADYGQRTINEARLFDVSVVTYPASPSTSVVPSSPMIPFAPTDVVDHTELQQARKRHHLGSGSIQDASNKRRRPD